MIAPEQAATIHIIAGPTASGKSTKALEIARRENGVIINCDSLQIYNALPILTAQPSAEDHNAAPHALYNILHPNEQCSAGSWRARAMKEIETAFANNQTPIICGGTGLYIKTLMEGLSPMPEVPDEIREQTNALAEKLGSEGLHAELEKRDPEMAARFHPSHSARIIRAYEVLEATGKSLAHWQSLPLDGPPAHWHFEIHKIIPERELLKQRCDLRFEQMINNGALEEVSDLDARIQSGEIRETAMITKALGFKPLRSYMNGEISREEAISQGQLETRQYAKRQLTWLRNQL